MGRLVTFIVCFMVFMPLGADVAILVGYQNDNPSWWNHLALIFLAGFIVFTDGLSRIEY